ncbi:MAG: type II CAAX prenyl endopeptidase Rce1 family protein [Ktedonobacterales bacterium]
MNRDGELYSSTESPALVPPTNGIEDEARYGQVGKVPWTFAQTLLGTAVTIVPWLVLVVLSQAVTVTTTSPHRNGRLAPAVDVLGGISFLVFTALVEGAFLLAPLIIAMRTRAPGTSRLAALRALGLRATRVWPAVAWVALGMVVVIVVTIVYGAVIQLFHLPLETNGQTLATEAETMPFTVIGALIGAVFIAPFCEEIFFRGFLFGGLLRGMSVIWATLVSTLLFTIAHGDVGSAVPLFAIGIMLAVIRWRTGSIWPGMALHMLNNALAAVLVVATILGMVAR